MMECFFKSHYKCDPQIKLQNSSRINAIIDCSNTYGDDIHTLLEPIGSVQSIKCHKNCISRYTSTSNTLAYKNKSDTTEISDVPYKKRCSGLSFQFKKHCLMCRDITDCILPNEYDDRIPLVRRTLAYPVRSVDTTDGTKFKQKLLDICNTRNDDLGCIVRDRIMMAVSDLHAADARYHAKCYNKFKYISTKKELSLEEMAFRCTYNTMNTDQQRIWNANEVYCLYLEEGGNISRRKLINKILCEFGDDLVPLTSHGYATLFVFKHHVAKSINLEASDDDDLGASITKVGKQIEKECMLFKQKKTSYTTHINKTLASECASETLLKLLSCITSKFDNSLSAIMVANIVTNVVTTYPTLLQIALGVLLGHHKSFINELYKYSLVCSYDEVKRFKRSAAVQAHTKSLSAGLNQFDTGGLVQVLIDNFDAVINTQNCKLDCHCLAMVIAQPSKKEQDHVDPETDTIPRLSKIAMSDPIISNINVKKHQGPKNPPMPVVSTILIPPSEEFQKITEASVNRANENDFSFMYDIIHTPNTPEYNGYNTRLCRITGLSTAPATTIVYMPLIDMTPSDPDTILTALSKGGDITSETGQNTLVVTCDQQLYKVVVDILFNQPALMSDIIAILGGMHYLMSFFGCIGNLMAGSGLKEVLSATFGSVDKMLIGKKFPQNIRALRLLTEEILRPIFEKHHDNITCMNDLDNLLTKLSDKSRTTKMWVDIVIKPCFIIMKFIRASHEGDWALHLSAAEDMLPYMFAANHQNYARYGLHYIRSMGHLPPEIHTRFMKGEQTLHHNAGLCNGMWSDQFIETTYMRHGHGPSGIIGTTMKPDTLQIWAYSMYACTTLINELKEIDGSNVETIQMSHKEEMHGRIQADTNDRCSVHKSLENCIDPMDPSMHPDSPVNIVTGLVAPLEVNVDNAVKIGQKQMQSFEASWPEGFYKPISKEVMTFASKKRQLKVGDIPIVDQEAIYARVIGLLVSQRDINFNDVLATELATFPPSMFEADGSMRDANNKSALKKTLAVFVLSRHIRTSIRIIDGSAILWTIPWPKIGTVHMFIEQVKQRLFEHLTYQDVYIVFDRYRDFSIKSSKRLTRASCSRVLQLALNTPLPANRKAILTVTKNKIQLNSLICSELLNDTAFTNKATRHHKLVVTGDDRIPIQVYRSKKMPRLDLESSAEEADIMIAQQAVITAGYPDADVTVESDDTDVFVLLSYFYITMNIETMIIMQPTVKARESIDIGATARKHIDIIPQLLAIHAITGCDTVASTFGIGKPTAIKIAKKGFSLSLMGNTNSTVAQIEKQATTFMSACYGNHHSDCKTMTHCRQRQWTQLTGKSNTSAPTLRSLPSTTESFRLNVKRSHFQVVQWMSAMSPDLPEMNALEFGWEEDVDNKILLPQTIPVGTPYAPDYILKLIRCGCESANPCRSGKCSCRHQSCTVFCACGGGKYCSNPNNIQQRNEEIDDNE